VRASDASVRARRSASVRWPGPAFGRPTIFSIMSSSFSIALTTRSASGVTSAPSAGARERRRARRMPDVRAVVPRRDGVALRGRLRAVTIGSGKSGNPSLVSVLSCNATADAPFNFFVLSPARLSFDCLSLDLSLDFDFDLEFLTIAAPTFRASKTAHKKSPPEIPVEPIIAIPFQAADRPFSTGRSPHLTTF
jgi:hypothetical protein